MALLLGIDVGTTNLKAAVFDGAGQLVALARTRTPTHYDSQGQASYDPRELWRELAGTIASAVKQVGSGRIIDAVAVSSMSETVVPVDERGEPLSYAIAWFDTRSLPQARLLENSVGRERVFALTGLDINPIFSVPKVMWYRQHEPDVFARASKWLCVSDYVNWKLAGVFVTDYTIASRTMALDLERRTWSEEILGAAGLSPHSFPEICMSGTIIGHVTDTAAAETGLAPGTPVVMGGHDHLCASLAAGALLGERVLDSSGTSESVIGISRPGAAVPKTFRGLRIGRYLDPSRYATWGGVISSGASVDWAIECFASLSGWICGNSRYVDTHPEGRWHLGYTEVMTEAGKTPPGARGLLFLPHLRGCGAPHWEPRARGALVGLRSIHTQPDLMRAVVEGLCFEVRLILDTMESVVGHRVEMLSTVGGAAHNAFWQQTKADITGRVVEVPVVNEASAMGAALLAGIGISLYRDMSDATAQTYKVSTRFVPRAEFKETYATLFKLYTQVYEALLQVNTGLHDFAGN